LEKIFDLYNSLGFYDMAIENGKNALDFDNSRFFLYQKLSDVYEKQRKYFAAWLMINKYIQVAGENAGIDSQLKRIRNKLYLD
jgi:hypothetical protein